MTQVRFLMVLLGVGLVAGGCSISRGGGRGGDDDDVTGDDDDSGADDDDATGDDDDATGDDDDATGDDDDVTGDDDDDDATGDDDDATGDDDDDATGDDDDATTAPPGPGAMIITEVMINPLVVDDLYGEWIELLNVSGGPLDLSGWTLSDLGSDSVIVSPGAPLPVGANQYVILGRSTVPGTNGGAPVDWAYGGSFTLANGEDEVILTAPTGVQIYAMNYTSAFPNPAGVSTQLHGGRLNYAASLDLATNWCSSSVAGAGTYGAGDTGTPDQPNPACPP